MENNIVFPTKSSKILPRVNFESQTFILSRGVKIYSETREWERKKNACVLWVAVGLFIWEDIASAPKSLGAYKCDVFVKQQKVQRKERAWRDRETEAKRKKMTSKQLERQK